LPEIEISVNSHPLEAHLDLQTPLHKGE